MKNKDNKFKLIIRTLVISFILYSMYVVVFPPKDESIWLVIAYPIGALTLLGIAIIGLFSFVGLCTFLVTRLLGWAFNTDFFD